MESIKLSIEQDGQLFKFDVAEYPHHKEEACRFEVFQNGAFVAGFEPDKHEYLRICRNPGILEEGILYLIADKLEALQL